MKRFVAFFLFAPLLCAGVIPGRYIVELSNESVAEHMFHYAPQGVHGRAAMRSTEADAQRTRIRAQQQDVRTRVEQLSGRIVGQVEEVSNALIVRIPDAQAAQLAALPGVKKVYPVRKFYLMLDHALPLHKVPDAWSQVGLGNAGAGVKIAIIDTGIDQNHPGFQNTSLTVPGGFPRANTAADLTYTNQKVIVARSYASLFASPDPDPSPADHVGHGTATAMCAAGVQNAGPLATISGVAPQAWVGSYKVFGSPGVNDYATEDAILTAINDAVGDGMDVISMSLGSDVATRFADDPEVTALEQAAANGIIVVAAAGNNGPNPGTIGSPGNGPSAIAVGATNNDRAFTTTVTVNGQSPVASVPGNGPAPNAPVTAPMVDVASLDGTGTACSALPRGSLNGAIAFILRGPCTFEQKLDDAQAAGAVAAVIYTDQARPDPIPMAVGQATLPAQMIGYQDGVTIKPLLKSPAQTTMSFTLGPMYVNPARLADFSSQGPNVDFSIKPDLVAVGVNLYMATEKLDPQGAMYSPDGYTIEQGTSFSAPLVAGAAALLKAARPGLTAAQYRSLLVNSADPASLVPGTAATVQQAGAGVLDAFAALNATAAMAPVSLNFGSGPSTVSTTLSLAISNTGTAGDTYTLSATPSGTGPMPSIQPATVRLDPGASATVSVTLTGSSLAPGAYQGVLLVQGANTSVTSRVPYWYGVPSDTPQYITVLFADDTATAGTVDPDAILFKITDGFGMPITDAPVNATVVSGTAVIANFGSRDREVPSAYGIDLRFGRRAGSSVIRITAGNLTEDVTVTAQ